MWSEQLLPRVEAKPFGVPNTRTVLLVKIELIGRVELLIEVSKTDNGKFFIVVFQRFKKIKPSAKPNSEEFVNSSSFDDITVKEIS